MPRQLVFASVPAGLAPGRSGYCTAARSAELGERLVRELETAGAHEPGEGVAYTFRLLRAGSETCAVLTRYADAGPDYTGRASTLAHHLVFSSDEIAAMPPPADIARRFTGWLDRWDGPPRLLDGPFHLAGTPASLPASAWKRLAGDAGKKTFAVICQALNSEYWNGFAQGARDGAAAVGVNVAINGPMAETMVTEQIAMIEAEISKGCDGLLVAANHRPNQPERWRPLVHVTAPRTTGAAG